MSKVNIQEYANAYNTDSNTNTNLTYTQRVKNLAQYFNIHGATSKALFKKAYSAGLIALLDETKSNAEPTLSSEETPIDTDSLFYVKHKSVLTGKDGEVKLTWEKSSLDEEKRFKAVKNALLEMMKDFEGRAEPSVKIPKFLDKDLLTFYPLPDLHFGLLVSKEESNHGYDYDLKIAKSWVLASMKHLVSTAPRSQIAVITDLGDFLHAADNSARTKSGHVLDTDGRHYKIVKTAFEVTKTMIEEALTKHETVYFYSVAGNHSDNSCIYLKAYLDAWFRNEPRVIIVDGNQAQQYHLFGKNIIGFTHGHELAPNRCSETLVFDNYEQFSASRYRYFHFGHFHHNKKFEGALVNVEIHKNIIPRDAWAENMGFRGHIGEAKSITYHAEYGEIGRSTFNIQMMEEENGL
jgi:hypothetical protein